MRSRHKFHLVKVEVEENHMLEEEEEAQTEVEEAALQAQVEKVEIKSNSRPKLKSSTRLEV